MTAGWRAASARFSAMSLRERSLVAAAALAVSVLAGDALWAGPQWARASLLEKRLLLQSSELAKLEAQLREARAGVADPDAANRAALADLRRQQAAMDARLRDLGNVLVPPDRMTDLLRSLLARHRGLELVSLQTLPPAPLMEGAGAASEEGKLFKHGIEIRLGGPYLDLLAYLAELEASPQRLLWGEMSLAVRKHPRTELTLIVYTLSLEKTWLKV